jgi:hypothetical protein
VSDGTDLISAQPEQKLRGRARIAHAIGRSERTVTRWIKKGILPPFKAGPFRNSILEIDGADLERVNSRGDQKGAD